MRSRAILKTGSTFNPSCFEGEYAEQGQTAYVLKNMNGRTIIATSWGQDVELEELGVGQFHHDQSGRAMGAFQLVGIVAWAKDDDQPRGRGWTPNRRIPHYVYK